MKKILIQIYNFAVICAAILAAIGGTAYLTYYGEYLFALTNLCVVAMAGPYVQKRANNMMSNITGDESSD